MSKIFKSVQEVDKERLAAVANGNGRDIVSDNDDIASMFVPTPVPPTSEPAESEAPAPAAQSPSSDSEQSKSKRSKTRSKRRRGNPVRRIVWAAIGLFILAFIFLGHMNLRVGGAFNILPIENADVRATVEGIIEKIYVDEGSPVKAGAVIARLYDKDLQTQLHTTEASIVQTEANLNKLRAGPTENEIEVARASVAKAEDTLKYAGIRAVMIKKGFDEGLLSRKEYEDAVAAETAARNDLALAKDQLKVLVSGSRPEDIAATRAQVTGLETQRINLAEQLRYVNVLSPAEGIIATPSRQLREMRGQLAKRGDLIAKVYNLNTVTAQISISEKEIGDVRVGQKVALRARAFPDRTFFGTVVSIATSAQASSGSSSAAELVPTPSSPTSTNANKFFLIDTEIQNDALLLRPEMTGQAKVDCGRRRILELISRRLARTFKVELWPSW
jgi:multidrug resistance efflux pump